ncbi:hypothetical protein ABIA14_004856 [Sinorhizobium fredii]
MRLSQLDRRVEAMPDLSDADLAAVEKSEMSRASTISMPSS